MSVSLHGGGGGGVGNLRAVIAWISVLFWNPSDASMFHHPLQNEKENHLDWSSTDSAALYSIQFALSLYYQ